MPPTSAQSDLATKINALLEKQAKRKNERRISYTDLVEMLSEQFGKMSPRDPTFHQALGRLTRQYKHTGAPILTALVVRRGHKRRPTRPGLGYFRDAYGLSSDHWQRGIKQWEAELDNIRRRYQPT